MALHNDPSAWFAPFTVPRSSREGELWVIKIAQIGNAKTPAKTLTNNTAKIPAHNFGEFVNSSDLINLGRKGTHCYPLAQIRLEISYRVQYGVHNEDDTKTK